MKPIYWLVDFPTHQYKEDVNELAAKAGLSIIDAMHRELVDPDLIADKKDCPKLSKAK